MNRSQEVPEGAAAIRVSESPSYRAAPSGTSSGSARTAYPDDAPAGAQPFPAPGGGTFLAYCQVCFGPWARHRPLSGLTLCDGCHHERPALCETCMQRLAVVRDHFTGYLACGRCANEGRTP